MSEAPRLEIATARLPTRLGSFRVLAFPPGSLEADHVVVVKGEVAGRGDVPVRIHSECVTGDVLGSRRCDCRAQLEAALGMIERSRCGVLVYLRQEGRGIGLYHKIRAYRLQELGRDTMEANLELGFEADQRSYRDAARILTWIGVSSVRLITNNRLKIEGLREAGLRVTGRIPIVTQPDDHNASYLRTKAERMGHLLDLVPAEGVPARNDPAPRRRTNGCHER